MANLRDFEKLTRRERINRYSERALNDDLGTFALNVRHIFF